MIITTRDIPIATAAPYINELIGGRSNVELLDDVESEIYSRCKKIFVRAYVLESDYGDMETAKKLYEVIVTMPTFEGNSYPSKACKRLENLRKMMNVLYILFSSKIS